MFEPDPPERHRADRLRTSEVPCACPAGCACSTPVLVGEGACEGCAPDDDGNPGTDHLPCALDCGADAPHFGPDGSLQEAAP